MSKDQTVTHPQHVFSLIPTKPECYFTAVYVDFTPSLSLSRSSNSIIPTFLNDAQFFTPAFVIPRDRSYYRSTSDFEREQFTARVLKADKHCLELDQQLGNPNELTLASPTSTFCQVCKKIFASYFDHMKEESHWRQTCLSKGNSWIKQTAKKLGRRKPSVSNSSRCQNQKEKRIQKLNSNQINQRIRLRRRSNKNQRQLQIIKNLNHSTNASSLICNNF